MADILRTSGVNAVRRRTTVARPITGAPVPRKTLAERLGTSDREHTTDSSRHALYKFENSYRLQPPPKERFEPRRVENLMYKVLEERLRDVTYEHAQCQQLAKDLAEELQQRVKEFRWSRYKIVCQVTLGQQTQQGTQVVSRCLWDPSLDSYASITHGNKSIFAVAQCYGVYYE